MESDMSNNPIKNVIFSIEYITSLTKQRPGLTNSSLQYINKHIEHLPNEITTNFPNKAKNK